MAGRKPLSDRAMTNAERQARFRQAHANGQPKLRFRRPADRRSRPQRWRDAVAELVALKDEYAEWLGTMPDQLRESPTGETLQAIADLDLSEPCLPAGRLRRSSHPEDSVGTDDLPALPGNR